MQTSRERTDSYAERGGHAMQRFQFSCIQSGNAAVLRSELQSKLYREGILRLFGNEVAEAQISLTFICAQAWYAAVQAGVAEKTADSIFDTYSRQIRMSASMEQILNAHSELLIAYADAVARLFHPTISSPNIQRCTDYIRAHICQPLTVRQVASALGFSESYLSREFTAVMRQTMLSYIQEEKIRTAKLLLMNPDFSVQYVMEYLGYVSQSHFTKLFREKTGTTPARFRTSEIVHQGAYKITDAMMCPGRDRTADYLRLVEYASRSGTERQQYFLACVRRGRAETLEAELQNAEYYAETCALFSGKLDLAIEAMLAFWPQVMHAACDSGMSNTAAVQMFGSFTAQLYGCLSVSEVLDLNRRYLTEQAKAVSQL